MTRSFAIGTDDVPGILLWGGTEVPWFGDGAASLDSLSSPRLTKIEISWRADYKRSYAFFPRIRLFQERVQGSCTENRKIPLISNCMQSCSERWSGRMILSFCIVALKDTRRRKCLIKVSSNTGHDSISSSVSSSNQSRVNFCNLFNTTNSCPTLRGLRQYGPLCAITARRPHPQRRQTAIFKKWARLWLEL